MKRKPTTYAIIGLIVAYTLAIVLLFELFIGSVTHELTQL